MDTENCRSLTNYTIILFILLLAACLLASYCSTISVRADTASFTRVYGTVFDSRTDLPLPDAYVIFTRSGSRGGSTVIAEVNTDPLGRYEAWIEPNRLYEVYVYHKLTSSVLDYVPARQRISLENVLLNVSFALLPGASIHLVGDLSFLGDEPLQTIFIVTDQSGILHETDSITEYTLDTNRVLNLDYGTIVVPSDTPIKVRVDLTYKKNELHLDIEMEGNCLNLDEGAEYTVDLRKLVVGRGVDYAQSLFQHLQNMMEEAKVTGFYLSYEGIRLERAENLVEHAQSSLLESNYDQAHADSHEAYLICEDLENSLLDMYENASSSVFFITPFLAITAVSLAFVLSESGWRRLTQSLIFYTILFGLLYLLYPGYNALQIQIYSLWANPFLSVLVPSVLVTVSFIAAYFVVLKFPHIREETSVEGLRPLSAIIAAFALAARNLVRRRFRTLLTSALITTSVFAFILLTSFAFEYGLHIQQQPGQAPSEGFLLQKTSVEESQPFAPIEAKILQWLKEQPQAVSVVPMIENTPKLGVNGPPAPLTTLYAYASDLNLDISAVMGVFPNLEARVTNMDTIIVRGRFLSDLDTDGILISEKAAKELYVEPNDALTLYGRTFNVTGIFDSQKLDALKDLDGLPLSPQYAVMEVAPMMPPMYTFYYVPGDDIVIMHGETAQQLPEMVISRVNVQTRAVEEIEDFTRLAVLIWSEAETFTYVDGKIYHLSIGPHNIETGFMSSTVPLFMVVLNVAVTMMGAVYERKREATTMSCVGLNPFHITAVFIAEALVMGILAGSLGYVLGLMGYRIIAVYSVSLLVKQKVEAVWGILALCFSIAAGALGSALPSWKASLITTPSLLRKFAITSEEKPQTPSEPWRLNMPMKIQRKDLPGFFDFMQEQFQRYISYSMETVENLKMFRPGADGPSMFRLGFTYKYTDKNVVTENKLYALESGLPNWYDIQLESITRHSIHEGRSTRDEWDIHKTAEFIRHIILLYTSSNLGTS